MDKGPKMFYDFIMERTQDGKKEQMEAVLEDFFKPPQDGKFDPGAFQKRIEAIISMLKPEAVPEFRKKMNPFGDDSEPAEIINPLAQPNRDKWRNHFKDATKEQLQEAFECAKHAHEMECDCWNKGCVFYGDCKKCMVFHLCLKQFPTCMRHVLGDLEEHYIIFSRDQNK